MEEISLSQRCLTDAPGVASQTRYCHTESFSGGGKKERLSISLGSGTEHTAQSHKDGDCILYPTASCGWIPTKQDVDINAQYTQFLFCAFLYFRSS